MTPGRAAQFVLFATSLRDTITRTMFHALAEAIAARLLRSHFSRMLAGLETLFTQWQAGTLPETDPPPAPSSLHPQAADQRQEQGPSTLRPPILCPPRVRLASRAAGMAAVQRPEPPVATPLSPPASPPLVIAAPPPQARVIPASTVPPPLPRKALCRGPPALGAGRSFCRAGSSGLRTPILLRYHNK